MALQEGPPRPKYEKFSEAARVVLASAEIFARTSGSNLIHDGHLFLALMDNASVVGVLEKINMDPKKLKKDTKILMGERLERGKKLEGNGWSSFSGISRKVFELAVGEARRRKDKEITPVDLLIGMVHEGNGITAEILQRHSGYEEHPHFLAKIRDVVDATITAEKTSVKSESGANKLFLESVRDFLEDPKIDPRVMVSTTMQMANLMRKAQKPKPKSNPSA